MDLETQEPSLSTENHDSNCNSNNKVTTKCSKKPSKPKPKASVPKSKSSKKISSPLPSNGSSTNLNKCKACRRKLDKDCPRCSNCQRGYHSSCLKETPLECTDSTWLCLRCRICARSKTIKGRNRTNANVLYPKSKSSKISSSKQIKLSLSATKKRVLDPNRLGILDLQSKFPQYFEYGRLKSGIEDSFFELCANLVPGAVAIKEKPIPSLHPSIEKEELAEILQIWEFFSTFTSLLKIQKFTLEFLHISLSQSSNFEFLNSLVFPLVYLFTSEKVEDNDASSYVLGCWVKEKGKLEEIFPIAWPDFLRDYLDTEELPEIEDKSLLYHLSGGVLSLEDIFLPDRILLFQQLIEIAYSTKAMNKFWNDRHEEKYSKAKEKTELTSEIRGLETSMNGLGKKISEIKARLADHNCKLEFASRLEAVAILHSIDDEKKELTKLELQLSKSEQLIERRKTHLELITATLPFEMNPGLLLGLDAKRTEYWFFWNDRRRLYLIKGRDSVYFYDSVEQIELLLASLNTKGIREFGLADKLKWLLSSELLTINPPSVSDSGSEYNEDSEGEEEKIGNNVQKQKFNRLAVSPSKALQFFKEMIISTERLFFDYLNQKHSKWTSDPFKRDNFLNEISQTTKISELRPLLQKLEQEFSTVEVLISETHQIIDEDSEDSVENYNGTKCNGIIHTPPEYKRTKVLLWGLGNEAYRQVWFNSLNHISESFTLFCIFVFAENVKEYVFKKNEALVFENSVLAFQDSEDEDDKPRRSKRLIHSEPPPKVKRWDDECKRCKKAGKLICCDSCPSVFHLECVGIKEIPSGSWHCITCLQRLSMTRQTRSGIKKFS